MSEKKSIVRPNIIHVYTPKYIDIHTYMQSACDVFLLMSCSQQNVSTRVYM